MPGATDRAGAAWERKVADYAHETYGLPWDKAPTRGRRDLLDITGCLDFGWLIGCKAIHRGISFGTRVSEAMTQCDRALVNAGRPAQTRTIPGRAADTPDRDFLVVDNGRIVPVQVMMRSGFPVGKAYVVTQYDYFLGLVAERAEHDGWRPPGAR
jgi:hypothetical protein